MTRLAYSAEMSRKPRIESKPEPVEVERRHRHFYSQPDSQRYGRDALPKQQPLVTRLISQYLKGTEGELVLDLGCGKGALRGCHVGYLALDYSHFALSTYLVDERRVCADMQKLPFKDETVHMILSLAALEHVPFPEKVLDEIDRVLKPGGVSLLAPAWFCRPWRTRGLDIRPYSELGWRDKVAKSTIPLRNSLMWRGIGLVVRRVYREVKAGLILGPMPFDYRCLQPNLDTFTGSDSDAFTSMDPHAAILYFLTRGYKAVSAPSMPRRLVVRHEAVVVRKAQLT
jgi:SAM-dependent methyltransferase